MKEPPPDVTRRGVTTHYELHDDGYWIRWAADFPGDEPGSRKLTDAEAEGLLPEDAMDRRTETEA